VKPDRRFDPQAEPTERKIMSLSLAIAVNILFVVALLSALAWFMSHPRKLTAHISSRHPGRHLSVVHEEAQEAEAWREQQERIAA
jgi:hypothetical protein